MKKTPLKRKTALKSKTPLKAKTPLKNKTALKRKTGIKVVGTSTTAELKKEIQSTLRKLVILRDGGCLLRHASNKITPRYKECGGYTSRGALVLQAEHLHTRSNMASFADPRLVICICSRHHIFYKPQHSDEYYQIVKELIGKERAELLKKVQEDHKPHKVDLKLALIALKQELKELENKQIK